MIRVKDTSSMAECSVSRQFSSFLNLFLLSPEKKVFDKGHFLAMYSESR